MRCASAARSCPSSKGPSRCPDRRGESTPPVPVEAAASSPRRHRHFRQIGRSRPPLTEQSPAGPGCPRQSLRNAAEMTGSAGSSGAGNDRSDRKGVLGGKARLARRRPAGGAARREGAPRGAADSRTPVRRPRNAATQTKPARRPRRAGWCSDARRECRVLGRARAGVLWLIWSTGDRLAGRWGCARLRPQGSLRASWPGSRRR